jgi:hypothetical protein
MQQQPERDVLEVFLSEYRSNLAQTLEGIAWYIKKIIAQRSWESKNDQGGKPFTSFEHWVVDRGYWGLRSTISQLLDFCKADHEAQALIRAEVGTAPKNGEIGNGRSRVDAIKPTDGGTSQTYLLKRMKRDFPDAAQRVVDGESAHSVAVELGILPKSIRITDKTDVDVAAARIKQVLGDSFAKRLREVL